MLFVELKIVYLRLLNRESMFKKILFLIAVSASVYGQEFKQRDSNLDVISISSFG